MGSAVDDALAALRQAMIDEGQDEGAVDAKLNAAMPNVETLSGNFADLNRLGAAAAAAAEEETEEDGYETWTKAELQAELDAQGIDYASSDSKADLIARLEGG